jgi:hypothetical protein
VNCANGNTDLLPRIIHAMLPKHGGLNRSQVRMMLRDSTAPQF